MQEPVCLLGAFAGWVVGRAHLGEGDVEQWVSGAQELGGGHTWPAWARLQCCQAVAAEGFLGKLLGQVRPRMCLGLSLPNGL